MGRRVALGLGVGAAMIWSVGLLWVAARYVSLPIFALMPTIMTAFLAPGLVMAAMLIWGAWCRGFTGEGFETDSPGTMAAIDRHVVRDTMQHLVLGLCIWPAAAVLLGGFGPGVIVMLGAGLAVARVLYWLGCHLSLGLRVFGQAASLGPTLMVAGWALWTLSARF
ncbi:MAPEG family protein [Rhodobacteraceae bacterium KMM 6894]|nr:MAPEG family protein [Rhodobacteraceae bacterium KMM 6894]